MASLRESTTTAPLSGPSTSHTRSPSTTRHSKTSSQIYVLSADGSRLYLLDPTVPDGREDPPAYHTIQSPTPRSAPPLPTTILADHDPVWDIGAEDDDALGGGGGPSSPRSVRIQQLPAVRSASSTSLRAGEADGYARHRAYTTSSTGRSGRAMSASGALRVDRELVIGSRRAGLGVRAQSYTPQSRTSGLGAEAEADEVTPLLSGQTEVARRRGMMRSIICGEVDEGDERRTWRAGWKRFWNPLIRTEYWRCVLHLLVLNFPFALLIWPFLFAGTVAGTALLITLPIGAAVWWLTLILARIAARLEIMMQTHHHSPLASPLTPVYHPIFHRIIEAPSLNSTYSPRPGSYASDPEMEDVDEVEVIWETGFIKCSWAMFCDYYSYSALSYFVLLKPLITLFSSIALLVIGAISLGSILGIPIYLRMARRWGQWQAGYAIENL